MKGLGGPKKLILWGEPAVARRSGWSIRGEDAAVEEEATQTTTLSATAA